MDFKDGTAEILCNYGTDVSIVYTNGFSITSNGHANKLDDSAKKRLENDLSGKAICEWSPEWNDSKKKIQLAEYILKIS